jgi:hypothetical protein
MAWLSRKYPNSIKIEQWSEESLIDCSRYADIALIPISPNDDLAKLKHECKMLIFWQLGVPTIQTGTKSYKRVASEANLNEYCVNSMNDWNLRINQLSEVEEHERVKSLQDEYILENHNLAAHIIKWDEALRTIL